MRLEKVTERIIGNLQFHGDSFKYFSYTFTPVWATLAPKAQYACFCSLLKFPSIGHSSWHATYNLSLKVLYPIDTSLNAELSQ